MLQVLAPLMIHLSPTCSARVITPARSDPPLGSESNWHRISSPRMAAEIRSRFCSSLPTSRIVAPQMVNDGVFRISGIS